MNEGTCLGDLSRQLDEEKMKSSEHQESVQHVAEKHDTFVKCSMNPNNFRSSETQTGKKWPLPKHQEAEEVHFEMNSLK